jgi:hypothetical protein
MARNITFRSTLTVGGAGPLKLPPGSPTLNAFAEHWVRSIKAGLSMLIPNRRPVAPPRWLIIPSIVTPNATIKVRQPRLRTQIQLCRETLGGLLKDYSRAA